MAYSYTTYTGNGSTTQYAVAFGYIRREHVLATVAGSPATFTWVNDSTIQMDVVPANGATVRVYRQTPLEAPLVDFTDGATLVAADLDTNAKQSIYSQQELDDSLVEGLAGVIPNGDKGDITTSVGGTVWTIDNGVVTSAKIADGTIVNADVNASAAIAATKLAFTPAGNIAATTVQAAIEELDTEKASTAYVLANVVPTGAVYFFAMNTAPTGYLKANGATISRTTYSALFSAIGTTYGAGDGSTTFALPDLRGEFIRGWDDARGLDSGRSIGTVQGMDIQSHNHGVSDPGHAHGVSDPGHAHLWGTDDNFGAGGGGGPDANGGSAWKGTTSYNGTGIGINGSATGVSINNSGGAETRPRNFALLSCIKF
jgi:hypothetical protein